MNEKAMRAVEKAAMENAIKKVAMVLAQASKKKSTPPP